MNINKLNKNDLKVAIKMNKEINNNLPLNIIDIFNALENNFSKIYTVVEQQKVLPFIVIKIQT